MLSQLHSINGGHSRFWVEKTLLSSNTYTLFFLTLDPPKVERIRLSKIDLLIVAEELNALLGWEMKDPQEDDEPQEYTLQNVEDPYFTPQGMQGNTGSIGVSGVNDESE